MSRKSVTSGLDEVEKNERTCFEERRRSRSGCRKVQRKREVYSKPRSSEELGRVVDLSEESS